MKFPGVKKEILLYFLPGAALFIYILIRAICVGVTYDEAWTLQTFVPLTLTDIINCSPCDANNHLLNTLLIKLFYSVSRETVFVARLPNVIAGFFYLLYAYKISKSLSAFPAFILFLLLTINPFLLDFFSLARGYGLALSFQIISIYHLLQFIKNKKISSANYALVFCSLAVLGNFSHFTFWVACAATLAGVAFFIHKENKLKFFIGQFIIAFLLVAIAFEPVGKLIQGGNLYYGGNDGFYTNTLVSLTKYTQYSSVVTAYTHLALNLLLVFTGAGICFLLARNFRKGFHSLITENALLFLLLIAILTSVAQHYILGTLYPIDRTALLYFPLFILTLCFSFNNAPTFIQRTALSLVLFFSGLNFIVHANSYKTALWYFDSHTASILTLINKEGESQNKKISIDFAWPFQGAVFYYDDTKKYPFVIVNRDGRNVGLLNSTATYYIYLNSSLEKVGYDTIDQPILKLKKDTVLSYPEESVYLFKNIGYK